MPIQRRTLTPSENTRASDTWCCVHWADSHADTGVARIVSSVISLPLRFGRFEDALKIAVESLTEALRQLMLDDFILESEVVREKSFHDAITSRNQAGRSARNYRILNRLVEREV